jgi:formylglycine-generating enzyme required for sulfatase activity
MSSPLDTKEINKERKVPSQENMVFINGGTFMMGSDKFYPEEKPVHKVTVDSFWIDKYPVTNKEFSDFVWATNYITVAERPLNPSDFPRLKDLSLWVCNKSHLCQCYVPSTFQH